MKRSSSDITTPGPSTPPSSDTSSTKTSKLSSTSKTPKTPKTPTIKKVKTEPESESPSGPGNGNTFTPDMKEAFMNRIISAGVAAIGSAALCEEFGLTKFQVNNATSMGKKNNMRVKACKAVRGD